MGTATAPLTEAAIREAVRSAAAGADVGELVCEFLAPIRYVPRGERGPAYRGALWDDLRASETARLDAIIEQVYQDLEGLICDSIETRVVAAALTFAAEYPDAPRAMGPEAVA
jgi:hypothetical protein